jgi:hypothetical protein
MVFEASFLIERPACLIRRPKFAKACCKVWRTSESGHQVASTTTDPFVEQAKDGRGHTV